MEMWISYSEKYDGEIMDWVRTTAMGKALQRNVFSVLHGYHQLSLTELIDLTIEADARLKYTWVYAAIDQLSEYNLLEVDSKNMVRATVLGNARWEALLARQERAEEDSFMESVQWAEGAWLRRAEAWGLVQV